MHALAGLVLEAIAMLGRDDVSSSASMLTVQTQKQRDAEVSKDVHRCLELPSVMRRALQTYWRLCPTALPPLTWQLSVEGACSSNIGSSVQELSVGRSVKHSRGTSTYSVQVKEMGL